MMKAATTMRRNNYEILLEAFAQRRTKRLVVEAQPEQSGHVLTLNGVMWSEDRGQTGPQEMVF